MCVCVYVILAENQTKNIWFRTKEIQGNHIDHICHFVNLKLKNIVIL